MACQVLKFERITREKFEAIKDAASSLATITGDRGEATKEGFTIEWSYLEDIQSLIIQCTNKPWLIPESIINAKINEMVEGA